MKKNIVILIILACVVLSGAAAYYFFIMRPSPPVAPSAGATAPGQREILYWRSPMDPSVTFNHPGKDKMGMDYIPVYADEASAAGVVKVSPAVLQNMNVKTVRIGGMPILTGVTTNGALQVDERTEYIVNTRVSGWIEKLYVNYTGEEVRKGEKLFEIYSPELVAAEQELLTAIQYNANFSTSWFRDLRRSGTELEKYAVEKLRLLDIPDSEIQRIAATKHVETDLTLYAKERGTVLQKNVIEGQKVDAGAPLLEIADLSDLWLLADVYENELAKVHVGEPAKLRFNFMPGKTFAGKVSFIYPTIDPTARTAKVRIDVPNSGGLLKPAMFATVELAGKNLGMATAVPDNCVIQTGTKNIVLVALGGGQFKPQPVALGVYSNGYYQVLSGLSPGMDVVSSAQFLISSESSLKEAAAQFAAGVAPADSGAAGRSDSSGVSPVPVNGVPGMQKSK